jgi:hypothetical protein
MVAHANDLRRWFGQTLGRSIVWGPLANGSSTRLLVPLEPGRYEVRATDWGVGVTGVWFRQGNVLMNATTAEPCTLFVPPTVLVNNPIFTFGVNGDGADDYLAAYPVGGAGTPTFQITKISAGKD